MSGTTRLVIAAVLVWVALGSPNPFGGGGANPYSGPYVAIHAAAAEMRQDDRAGLSEALEAAGRMMASDSAGLLRSTKDVQAFIRGTTAYGYTSFSVSKYPEVAKAVQDALEKALGDDIEAVDDQKRQAIAGDLKEMSEAVR